MPEKMEYTVLPGEDGRRVGSIIRQSMSVSYTALKNAKWNGRILLNGDPVFVDAVARAGDTVTVIRGGAAPAYTPKPYELPLKIPYRDGYLTVVDKDAPLASQSGAGHPDDSLENAFYSYLGCPEDFVYRPVNRLDRGTGGLMVIAETAHAQQLLQRQLHTPDFERLYLALTEGIPPEKAGRLTFPIAKAPGATVKRVVSPDGKPCETLYRVLGTEGNRAAVLLKLLTGRTHQIRVHLSAIGCPVCGDFLYGTELPPEFPERFALHSAALRLKHPGTGETLCFFSVPAWAEAYAPRLTEEAFGGWDMP